MDQYILGEVENGNYVEINPSEARINGHQLHFMGYNYVVSSTSTSTKVRITTDSSMHTESGLSLNGVTKPAPGLFLVSEAFYSVSHVIFSTLYST